MRNQLPLTPALLTYVQHLSLREPPSLRVLREHTQTLPLGVMQVAPEQAQFMQFLLRITGARKVLELGTFTGYSALSFALALPEDGEVITCDINPEWISIAKPHWEQSGVGHKITLRLGPAIETLNLLLKEGHAGSFDFIFIDADKTGYCRYYDLAKQLISPRGVIAIDNILWDGNVLDPQDVSPQTREIRRLNDKIREDQDVYISLLPIADGLFLVMRKDQASHHSLDITDKGVAT